MDQQKTGGGIARVVRLPPRAHPASLHKYAKVSHLCLAARSLDDLAAGEQPALAFPPLPPFSTLLHPLIPLFAPRTLQRSDHHVQ